jgi:tetratricopeptide (TPR) repeat protein
MRCAHPQRRNAEQSAGYPDYAGALHMLGLVLADKENQQQALDCLVRAAMLNPRSWTTLTALSGVYLRLGATEMAAQTLAQAKSLQPRDANVLLLLGDIYCEEREYELARDAYRDAVALKPTLVPAAVGLGWCRENIGEYAQAAAVFEDLIKRGMRTIEPIRALAVLPASVVSIDLLAQLDKVLREPTEDKAEFEISVAFMRSIALDRAGRHAQAWEHATQANRRVFLGVQETLKLLRERQRTSLAFLREHPGKAVADDGEDRAHPVSLFHSGAVAIGQEHHGEAGEHARRRKARVRESNRS